MVLFRGRRALCLCLGPRKQAVFYLFSAFLVLGSVACCPVSEDAGEQTILGNDESAWVTRTGVQPAFVTAAIDAIGVLGGQCTAFYIGYFRSLTAGHCFESQSGSLPKGTPCRSFNIKFGYLRNDRKGSHTSTCRYIEAHKNMKEDKVEDYAVIVIDNPPRVQLRINQNYVPKSNDPIAIVSHPAMKPLKHGICKVSILGTNPSVTGKFFHTCDTEGGSSGAPVFQRSTGAVIGIHVHGTGGAFEANGFVPLKSIPIDL